jgi:hypothetical protein
MSYYSEEEMGGLREQLEGTVLGWPGVRRKTMFGCPAYSAVGTLFAFLVTRSIVLTRLGEGEREELVHSAGAAPFQAGPRVVRGWIRVPLTTPGELGGILPLVRRSYETARDAPDHDGSPGGP